MAEDLALGLDVGTQGARALVLDRDGQVHGSGRHPFPLVPRDGGRHEQDPQQWLDACWAVLGAATGRLTGTQRAAVRAIAVTSTSGTLVLTDTDGRPLRPAIMWDDTRADAEAEAVAAHTTGFTARTGLRLRGSFPLVKLAWLERHEPTTLGAAAHLLHASDFLLWHLGVRRAVTDPTNALKTGYDVVLGSWDAIHDRFGSGPKLPEVVEAGTTVGTLDPTVAARLGLRPDVALVTAMTDANTSMLAAGVHRPGQWMSTLGTGLSIKGVLEQQLIDPTGAVYCHLGPHRHWIPSGTSHCGAAAISARFGDDLDALSTAAEHEPPGQLLVYPLAGRGEYFPHWNPDATAFSIGSGSKAAEFRSTLEGIAVIEALGYRRMAELGAAVGDEVVVTGGATRSALFTRIRAGVLNRTLRAVAIPETAVGAAITAFGAVGVPVGESIERMVRYAGTTEPDPRLTEYYQELIRRYQDVLDDGELR